MANSTTPELPTPWLLTTSNVTSVYNETTIGNSTVVTTESTTVPSTTVSSTLSLSTASSTAHTYDATEKNPNDSPVGAIAGGVVGGVVFIAFIIIIVLFLYRRRHKKSDSQPKKVMTAPGKEDIDRIEHSRRKNEYTPPPSSPQTETADLYTNVDSKGQPKESTDPALDPQGYLKAKSNQSHEPGNELYSETKTDRAKPHKKSKSGQDRLYVSDENQQALYVNKDVSSEQQDYLELSGGEMTKVKTDKKAKTSKGNQRKDDYYLNPAGGEYKSHRKADSSMLKRGKKENLQSNKCENKATDHNPSNDEIDEEYEIPDPTNYPEPKKTKTKADKQHNVRQSPSKGAAGSKVTNKKNAKAGKGEKKPKGRKYENIQTDEKNTKVKNDNMPVADDFYEVPENP